MAKEEAKIKIYVSRRRFGKSVTIVEGVEKDADPKNLTKKLKTKLACGGTFKEGKIELQGEHRARVRKILVESGFSESQIEVD